MFWKILNKIVHPNNVTQYWPTHSDIVGKELTNKVARKELVHAMYSLVSSKKVNSVMENIIMASI